MSNDRLLAESNASQPLLPPILLLGLPQDVLVDSLRPVLLHNLLYTTTSTFTAFDVSVRVHILQNLETKDLMCMAQQYNAPSILTSEALFDNGTVQSSALEPFRQSTYSAIVVDDTSLLTKRPILEFVQAHYNNNNHPISVVVLGVHGLFDLSRLNDAFGTDWESITFGRRTIVRTDHGKQFLPICDDNHDTTTTQISVEAHFVSGEMALFEHVPPQPASANTATPRSGSPVLVHFTQPTRAISYVGLSHASYPHYGTMVQRLCLLLVGTPENRLVEDDSDKHNNPCVPDGM